MVIVWMGVAKARGRPDWWGVFIIAPIANFILPGVLAWSDATTTEKVAGPVPAPIPPPKPATMPFCTNCGAPVDGRFCSNCGASTGPAAQPRETAPGREYAALWRRAAAFLTDATVTGRSFSVKAASALCYGLGPITGFLFLAWSPYRQNPAIRFHAWQSVFLSLAGYGGFWVMLQVTPWVLGARARSLWTLAGVACGLALAVLSLYVVANIYRGREAALPILGKAARGLAQGAGPLSWWTRLSDGPRFWMGRLACVWLLGSATIGVFPAFLYLPVGRVAVGLAPLAGLLILIGEGIRFRRQGLLRKWFVQTLAGGFAAVVVSGALFMLFFRHWRPSAGYDEFAGMFLPLIVVGSFLVSLAATFALLVALARVLKHGMKFAQQLNAAVVCFLLPLLMLWGLLVGPSRALNAVFPFYEVRDKSGDPELVQAVRWGGIYLVHGLIRNGANINAVNAKGETALHVACRSEEVSMAASLLQEGADVNARDKDGKTPLMVHNCFRSLAISHQLIRAGADVNARDNKGATALMYSAQFPVATRLLIAAGAEVNAQDAEGKTPLMYASPPTYSPETRPRPTENVRELMKAGANVNARDNSGKTFLMDAAGAALADVVDDLLKRGVDVDARDRDGATALAHATCTQAAFGREATVKALLRAGADVNVTDKRGATPLMCAANQGWHELVRDLIRAKAAVNAQDHYGWTALMKAALHGDTEMVEQLIRAGADVNLRENAGRTALSEAMRMYAAGAYDRRSMEETIRILREAGAQETGQATVKAETLNVYVQMSTHSKVVKTLKKGEVVTVDFEIVGAGGTWCSVKEAGAARALGYVLCQGLERVAIPEGASAGGATLSPSPPVSSPVIPEGSRSDWDSARLVFSESVD